jgi:hypothetical protein
MARHHYSTPQKEAKGGHEEMVKLLMGYKNVDVNSKDNLRCRLSSDQVLRMKSARWLLSVFIGPFMSNRPIVQLYPSETIPN